MQVSSHVLSSLPNPRTFGVYALFLLRMVGAISRSPGQFRALLVQLHRIGARSLPVIAVAGIFTGMAIAVQFFETLVRFGPLVCWGQRLA